MLRYKKSVCLIVNTLLSVNLAYAQSFESDTTTRSFNTTPLIEASLELQGIATSNKTTPFWLRANKFGSTPLNGYSAGWIARLAKNYQPSRENKFFDWLLPQSHASIWEIRLK